LAALAVSAWSRVAAQLDVIAERGEEGIAKVRELIEMAIAFVIRHPAVTSAITGPRTIEQLESQLPAANIELSDDVLDRIDQIVPPGTNINPADSGWANPALDPAARRR
jgi:aryl-alcohol dehydrogenase-like predicted oxidoreductase